MGLSQPEPGSAGASLERFGRVLRHAPPPETVSSLYTLWRQSDLDSLAVPASLGSWSSQGDQRLALQLDEMDLPAGLIADSVRSLGPGDSLAILTLNREPGRYQLLLVRHDSAHVLTVAIGPKTGLIPPSRIGRLLGARSAGRPLYRLALSPMPTKLAGDAEVDWREKAPGARSDHGPGGGDPSRSLRHRRARRPGGDPGAGSPAAAAELGRSSQILWMLAGMLTGEPIRRPFLASAVPVLRGADRDCSGDLLPGAHGGLCGVGHRQAPRRSSRQSRPRNRTDPPRCDSCQGDARRRFRGSDPASSSRSRERSDADFLLYREGQLRAGTSGGLLESLGLVSPVMDPEALPSAGHRWCRGHHRAGRLGPWTSGLATARCASPIEALAYSPCHRPDTTRCWRNASAISPCCFAAHRSGHRRFPPGRPFCRPSPVPSRRRAPECRPGVRERESRWSFPTSRPRPSSPRSMERFRK